MRGSAGARVEPAAVVEVPTVGKHHAADGDRRVERDRKPVLCRPPSVKSHREAARIAVVDRAQLIAVPRAALGALR